MTTDGLSRQFRVKTEEIQIIAGFWTNHFININDNVASRPQLSVFALKL